MVPVDLYPSSATLRSHLAAQYASPQAAGVRPVCRRVAEAEKVSQRGVAIADEPRRQRDGSIKQLPLYMSICITSRTRKSLDSNSLSKT